ncbi:MAG: CHRD domain-containing protein [Fimbriimonadaceae bacterium]|nr:CHRD domain-containing protein [Fimbriimonadaceae bacterium]
MRLRFALVPLFVVAASASMAQIFVYEGTLSGLNESPPNASPGTGWGRVTMDTGAVTMRVEASFSGLTGVTTASHIHARADASTPNGGVATQTPSFTGFPLGVTAGSYDHTFDMTLTSSYNGSFVAANGGTAASAWAALQSKMAAGLTYLNVHTQTFPGGELRADLRLVPEPATLAALGMGALALIRKRRKQS